MALLKMGFSYQEAMAMPEAEAIAFCGTFASLNSPKGNPQGNISDDHYNRGVTYKVRRPK